MHFLFRFVSVVVMLVALTLFGLIMANAKQYFTDTHANSSGQYSAPETQRPLADRLQVLARDLYAPMSLFCFAAMLLVLTRISWAQEQGKDLD